MAVRAYPMKSSRVLNTSISYVYNNLRYTLNNNLSDRVSFSKVVHTFNPTFPHYYESLWNLRSSTI